MALTKISRGLLSTGVSDSSDATAITIDSEERIIIGHTTALDDIRATNPYLQVLGSGLDTAHIGVIRFSDSVNGGHISIGKSRSGTVGTNTIVQDGDKIGSLNFVGGDGSDYHEGAVIEAVISGTPGTGDLPTALTFQTTADGANASTEAMRITPDNKVGIGTTSPDRLLHVKGSASTVAKFASTGNTVYIELNAADQAGGDAGYIKYNNTKEMSFWTDDTERIIVDSSGNLKPKTDAGYSGHSDLGTSSLRYEDAFVRDGVTTGSDRNEKENITESNLGLTFIKELQPVSYTWKNNSSNRTHYGLIAQDIETWLSDNDKSNTDFAALIKEDISEEQDGSNYRYGLRYTEFISPLIKAIQELSAKVEELESKINE